MSAISNPAACRRAQPSAPPGWRSGRGWRSRRWRGLGEGALGVGAIYGARYLSSRERGSSTDVFIGSMLLVTKIMTAAPPLLVQNGRYFEKRRLITYRNLHC